MGEIDLTDEYLEHLSEVGKRSQELAKAGKLGPLQPPKEHGPAPRTLPKLDDSKITETP